MRYICTFGCGQKWMNHYYVVHAYDEQSARVFMQEKFGQEWSMIYNSAETAGVQKFQLKELTNEMLREEKLKNDNFNVIEGVY